MSRFIFTTSIERDDDEIDVRVVYKIHPGTPERRYGDYPHPEEPAEVELIKAEFVGVDVATMPAPLTDAEEAALLRECEERAPDDLAAEQADAADWHYQERRDRQLMERWETEQ